MDNNTNNQAVETADIKQPNSHVTTSGKLWRAVLLVAFFSLALWSVWQITSHFSEGDMATLSEAFSNANMLYVVLSILLVAVLFFTDGLKYSLVNKMLSGKFDYMHCVNVSLMGKFYDNITPFNTGGQPYQVWMLHKRGYSASVSVAVPIIKYVVQLICMILVCLVLYIANNGVLDVLTNSQSSVIRWTTYFGIAIAALMPTAVILFSLMPKLCTSIILFFCNLLSRMRIVKDKDKASTKAIDFLENYSQTFASIAGKIVMLVLLFLLCIVDFLLVMAVPYFLLLALGETLPSLQLLWDVITLNAYTLFASSIVPTPGNSGAIELAYSMVFAPIPMGEGVLFWLVILWRTATYYIYIVIGLLQSLLMMLSSVIKRRRKVQ